MRPSSSRWLGRREYRVRTANFPRSVINEINGNYFPFVVDEDDWLISITDTDSLNAVPKQEFGRVLFMSFNDCDYKSAGRMTEAQADQMAEFIHEAMKLEKNVWVNCHMGICRSGAVVRLLSELGWELADKYSPERRPNMHVYQTLRKRFGQLRQSWDDAD